MALGRGLDFPQGLRGYAHHLAHGGQRLDNEVAAVAERLRTALGDSAQSAPKDAYNTQKHQQGKPLRQTGGSREERLKMGRLLDAG